MHVFLGINKEYYFPVQQAIFCVNGINGQEKKEQCHKHASPSNALLVWVFIPRAAIKSHHRFGGLQQQNFILLWFGGWKSKVTVSAGLRSP